MDPNPGYPVLPDWPIERDVYVGFWINRSLGKFRAATITLNESMWNMFVAFIALFVGATARSVWKLVRFALHHTFSISTAGDGVYSQRQAVLRNTSLATDAGIQALEISHAWRHRAKGCFGGRGRAFSLLSVAFAISVLSTAASFLSPKLFESFPSEVLIAGRHCGPLPYGDNISTSAGSTVVEYFSRKLWEDDSYATKCYYGSKATGCEQYVQPALPYTVDRHAPCPFATEICKLSSGNLLLDTGSLDSVKHLGLNQGPRFTLRIQTHCAPLVVNGHTTYKLIPNSTGRSVNFDYGEDRYGFVMAWPQYDDIFMLEIGATTSGYSDAVYKVRYFDQLTLRFIPQLTQADGMISLLFLDSSGIIYTEPTDDPWFLATTDASVRFVDSRFEPGNYYAADGVGVLGCSTRRYICNPDLPNSECINSLSREGSNGSISAIRKAWPDHQDQYRMYPLLAAKLQYGIGDGSIDPLYFLGDAPTLLARNSLLSGQQTAKLPSYQWQIEQERVFRRTLTEWQSSLVTYARGAWVGSSQCGPQFPCERTCYSQRYRSSDFHSFSAWSLFIFVLLGIAIMIVSLFLEELFDMLLRYTSLKNNQHLMRAHAEWKAGSTLQLQRIAHQNLGLGTWKRTDEAVPVTAKGDTLGIFDVSNPNHARLVKPQVGIELDRVNTDADTGYLGNIQPHGAGDDNREAGGYEDRPIGVSVRTQYSRLPSHENASTW